MPVPAGRSERTALPFDSPELAPSRRSRRPLDADQIDSPTAPLTRRAAREARIGAPAAPAAEQAAGAFARVAAVAVAVSGNAATSAPAAPAAAPAPAPALVATSAPVATPANAAPVAAPAPAAPVTAAIPVVPAAGDQAVAVGFDAALRALGNAEPARDARRSSPSASVGAPADAVSAHVAPVRARRSSARRVAALGATFGVMGVAGLLAVSMTLPAQAVAAAQGGGSAAATTSLVVAGSSAKGGAAADEIQAFIAPTQVHDVTLQGAQGFTAMSSADLAAEEGIHFSDSLYTNDTTAKIQWPFIVGVAMSSPYGMRDGVMHQGIDLIPGEGAPIQAIADGTVRLASESDGGYGVGVYIDHVIDGQPITSHYGHMQYGSLRVKTGDPIKVGDIIGLTGNTGHSFGAHLHFELYVNGSTIDPLPWMLAHAGRH